MDKNARDYPLDKVLMCAACEIAVNGYVTYEQGVATGADSTKFRVQQILQGTDLGKKFQQKLLEGAGEKGLDLFGATFKVAVFDVIQWVKKLNPADSDYTATIYSIAHRNPATVVYSEFGQVASMLMTYQRHLAARAQVYFGTVGHTDEVEVTVTSIKEGSGDYGAWFWVKAKDDKDTLINWFVNTARPDYDVGDELKIRGTVKDHVEFNGDKWTKLNRVKVLEGFGSKV